MVDAPEKMFTEIMNLGMDWITISFDGGTKEIFEAMREGSEFEAVRDLTSKILSIDPSYQDASILQRAATDLRGSKRPPFFAGRLEARP